MTIRKKYSYDFKVQCVELVVKGKRSVLEVARLKGAEVSNLRRWVSFYEKYGRRSLLRKGNRKYSAELKKEVLETIEREGLSLLAACVRFNIPGKSTIMGWQKVYESQGQAGLIAQRKGRPPKMKQPIKRKPRKSNRPLTREEELLKENEYLRAENELLKKLHALVQTNKKQKP